MKNQITKSIKNTINYLARKYSKNDKWKFDEITQELYISVLKSDENFREGTGACFQTYAIGNIKYAMFTLLNNQNNQKNETSKDKNSQNTDNFVANLNNADFFDFSEIFKSERTEAIFNLRFNKELALREISEIFGISKQRVAQIINVNLKNKKLIKILTGGGENEHNL